jgi:NAD(P)-dependent dehydrogenase (short-subunit alcohol dehydrogenase family)
MTNQSKTSLIFGGIGGIGGALADTLSQRGDTVYVTTSRPDRSGQTAVPQEQVLHADATQPDTIRAAVTTAGANGLNRLAYCVGTIDLKPLSRTTPEDLLRAFQINTLGAFIAMKEAAPLLAKTNGAIVLFSSVAASRGFPSHAAIATAKAGLEGLARSLAAELAPSVRINLIAPSLTETPLASGLTQNPKMKEAIAAMHPLSRLGQADEMAKAAAFLLSDDAGWITGQTLHIDGGRVSVEKPR